MSLQDSVFNLLAGKNFVPTWSHYFPDLSISLALLSRSPTTSIFLPSSSIRTRESNKYPVTVRNCSVHAGLIQPALLQHPRVYGRGKFPPPPLLPMSLLPPHARETLDRHGDFFFLPFFFNPPPVFAAKLFPSGGKTLENGGNSSELLERDRREAARWTIVEFVEKQPSWLIVGVRVLSRAANRFLSGGIWLFRISRIFKFYFKYKFCPNRNRLLVWANFLNWKKIRSIV